MRLVNAEEKSLASGKEGELAHCPAEGRSVGDWRWGFLVQLGPFNAESGSFESRDDVVDRLGVARLAFDLDHRVLGRKPGEDSAVVDLDDVDPGLVDLAGDRRQRSRLVVGGDVKPVIQLTGVTGSELAGPALSPDGQRMYFSSQRNPGRTYEVSGPFAPVAEVPVFGSAGRLLFGAALGLAAALALRRRLHHAPADRSA